MRIPRFWSKEQSDVDLGGFKTRREVWGWSLSSFEEAAANARESLVRIAKHLHAGSFDLDGYQYVSNPPREEIVREFGAPEDPAAIITRNAYGSLVLNTRDLMFVDVDCPEEPATFKGLFASLLGKKDPAPSKSEEKLINIGAWVGDNPDYRVRIYRTAAGFRVLIMNAAIIANSSQADSILEGLESDPLYRQLCRVQECFRARLTPKPWRIESGMQPPNRFPWGDTESERIYREWESRYEQAAKRFGTCLFIEEAGTENYEVSDTNRSLIQLHDELTGAFGNLPLA